MLVTPGLLPQRVMVTVGCKEARPRLGGWLCDETNRLPEVARAEGYSGRARGSGDPAGIGG